MNKTTLNSLDTMVYQYRKYDPLAGGYTLDFNDLEEIDKEELAARFLEEDGKDAYLFIAESPWVDSDIMPAIIKSLFKPGNPEALWNLRRTIHQAAIENCEKRAQEALQERLEWACHFDKYERGAA